MDKKLNTDIQYKNDLRESIHQKHAFHHHVYSECSIHYETKLQLLQ